MPDFYDVLAVIKYKCNLPTLRWVGAAGYLLEMENESPSLRSFIACFTESWDTLLALGSLSFSAREEWSEVTCSSGDVEWSQLLLWGGCGLILTSDAEMCSSVPFLGTSWIFFTLMLMESSKAFSRGNLEQQLNWNVLSTVNSNTTFLGTQVYSIPGSKERMC